MHCVTAIISKYRPELQDPEGSQVIEADLQRLEYCVVEEESGARPFAKAGFSISKL